MAQTQLEPGSLIRVRNREWVVLKQDGDLVRMRPIGGLDEEVTGLDLRIEEPVSAAFAAPTSNQLGDHRSCALLRDAVRLSLRSSTGPFRSLGRIAVEPRPYQIVPLLMALKMDPIRLLIADDVGIGKTVEACLIAREMLDRGEVSRVAVLCPPHLTDQWQSELESKFHIEATVISAGTAARLERHLQLNESLFDRHPFVIVSMEFIKAERRRAEFVRACPELVIVDEAHGCAHALDAKGKHQRHELIKQLSKDEARHMILVTATPHSGKGDVFRSLLGFLDPDFERMPDDLRGDANEKNRKKLAQHYIQRKRADIRSYLKETTFPIREEAEETYKLSPAYKTLFERAIRWARDAAADKGGTSAQRRGRWWSAIALLRSLASSPAAAESTLRERTGMGEDEIARQMILDPDTDELVETTDIVPGADIPEDDARHRELLDMARLASKISASEDLKLQRLIHIVKTMIDDGFNPIVFCRYIPTAEYVARELAKAVKKKGLVVDFVTGLLAPEEREIRIQKMSDGQPRVLVCTDCLSEGINLQALFSSVIHYDLAWSPTRHEQREGRVDRFGQQADKVRALTLYGVDNQIDGIVLDVLLRKHRAIRRDLGIAVPFPADTGAVMEAIFEGLLLREGGRKKDAQGYLPGFEDFFKPQKQELHIKWENASDKEKVTRDMFAQHSMDPNEVMAAVDEIRAAIGSEDDVKQFIKAALTGSGAAVVESGMVWAIDLTDCSGALKDRLDLNHSKAVLAFGDKAPDKALRMVRTHPVVENLSNYVLETALDGDAAAPAKRAGVIYTSAVRRRSTLLLLRCRYDLAMRKDRQDHHIIVEECIPVAYRGDASDPDWLSEDEVRQLLNQAKPSRNTPADSARDFIDEALGACKQLDLQIKEVVTQRAATLKEAHTRVRGAAKLKDAVYSVEPKLPPDLLGVFVYLPG